MIATAKSLIEESEKTKQCYEEMKAKEGLERSKLIRQGRIKCSHQVRRVQESLSKEKKEKTDLEEKIKSLKANRLAMAKKVNTLTTHLAVEVVRRTNLEDKITNLDNKYLDEKDKSTNERIKRRMLAGKCIEELRKR